MVSAASYVRPESVTAAALLVCLSEGIDEASLALLTLHHVHFAKLQTPQQSYRP
jgi:hypothetical protein